MDPASELPARTPHLHESMVAAIHRRAASGALLRDSRLEIAVTEEGEVVARVVRGVDERPPRRGPTAE